MLETVRLAGLRRRGSGILRAHWLSMPAGCRLHPERMRYETGFIPRGQEDSSEADR
jgi:hypothetical protein